MGHFFLGLNLLIHPVVLDMPMEGNLVTDIDIDSIALYSVLLLFLFFRIESEVCGPTPLPRRIAVRLWFTVERPSQLPIIAALLYGELSRQKFVLLIVLLYRGRGGERGTC